MDSNSTLYWSNLELYEKCPQRFLWSKGWEDIDVGGGLGRKKPKPVLKSQHHEFMGTVIQAVVERFYNDELYKLIKPDKLKERFLEIAQEKFLEQMGNFYIDWKFVGSRAELESVINSGVIGYLATMKAHKFLGSYARAEVDLPAFVDKYNPIGGRADLIIKREDTGVTILDGKNSKRDKSGKTRNDPDQLKWYALCYYLAYQKMPDRLAFVYYRYPFGMSILDSEGNETGEKESGISWVEFTKEDLKGLAQRAVEAKKGMHFRKFPAKPEPKNCRYCDYETVCAERGFMKSCNHKKEKEYELDIVRVNGRGEIGF